MRSSLACYLSLICVLFAVLACDGGDAGGDASDDGGIHNPSGSSGNDDPPGSSDDELPPEGPRCLVSAVAAEISGGAVEDVDLLFLVDNSNSMREEQAALRSAFPELLRALTSGDLNDDGIPDFAPASSLHLGVVSPDLGLAGVNGIEGCEGLGDNGRLNDQPVGDAPGCLPTYPRFLVHQADVHELDQTANDLACIARLGTNGCGFEQPLESVLKALWPSDDPRVSFLPDTTGFGGTGQGAPSGENAGFVRNDPTRPSVVAIVIVTDEEDCSSKVTTHFAPPDTIPPGDPRLQQGLNTRCFRNKDNLFALDERYLNAFRELRVGSPQLVVFSVIAGVPPELVTPERWSEATEPSVREQLYRELLAHPQMQEVIDDRGTPGEPGDDNLTPSCDRSSTGTAYPPRRLVELAEMFGDNGSVHSICQDDFTAAVRVIAEQIGKQLGAPCLPRPLVRKGDGLVGCNLVWELPPPGGAAASTPTDCDAPSFEFLADVPEGAPQRSDRGGARCLVEQLSVSDGELDDEGADGWYYDDFSDSVLGQCAGETAQRIAFTSGARPPTGVVVKLECPTAACEGAGCEDECSAGPASVENERVGGPCETEHVPEAGFDDREVYVETQNPECGEGVCLVYQLRGDPREGCVPSAACDPSDPACNESVCATESEIEARVYCSCRCDAPDGFDTCECPDGFACVPVLQQGSPAVQGSYCVREGTFSR